MIMTIEIIDPLASKYYRALNPEIESVPYKKTHSKIELLESDRMRITVEGDDLSAIRGTFNSYLNWIKIVEENLDI
ncbi:MAG: hypothetical protein JW825_03815 [Candidatus Methanofastidiosa archaeon]|nr:hypothetical protein [Candidatus Methanofastidiosa archaeon]